jgi:uncharacterized membrane protein (UPF0182 family)
MSTRIAAPARRWPLVLVVVVGLFLVAFTVMSGFYIDLLWFREIDLASTFWTVLRTKVLLGLVFGLVFFGMLYVSLLIAKWVTPTTRVLTPDQEIVERFRQNLEPSLRWLIPLGCAFLALIVGASVSGRWQTFLLWRNASGVTFGNPEPLFDRDPSFYVFSLPWLRFLQGWLFSALVGVTFLTAIAHFFWGGIRPQAPAFADKVAPSVRAHLSVLLGLILLVKAWGYYLGRFDLLTSTRGVIEGASYTDVKAQLPALTFLAIAAVICAGFFFLNVRYRNWALPIFGVGILAVLSVLLGTAYPAFVQQFSVKPQELQREREYIEYNIEGTRRAFGLDRIEASERTVAGALSADEVDANETTVSNIRLWRPSILLENFETLQRIRAYYEFEDVDVDRYRLSDRDRVLMVSAREVAQQNIPGAQTWQNRHLVYTHGFGNVAVAVNTASTEGAPIFTVKDIPPLASSEVQPPEELLPTRPQVYFGEREDVAFVVVGTKTAELDYEGAPADHEYAYDGTGGIPMGNLLQRALFAWRFRDVNLLISGQITAESRIMINRTIQERIAKPAPFLTFDGDPYLAVVEGRLVWIQDAYTTTIEYPYSEEVDFGVATDRDGHNPLNGIDGRANYIRNPVKAVVDAYDGSVTYYDMTTPEDPDPIIEVWKNAFPGMFTPISEAPAGLIDHLRYPENLFQIQAYQYTRYHVTDAQVFFQNQDVWQVATDPTIRGNAGDVVAGPAAVADTGPMRPYYQMIKLPGETGERFQLILPFVPQGRANMVAWMAADSDPEEYGRLVAYKFPAGRNIDGPTQVFSAMNQDPGFSSFRTLVGQQGSDVLFGDFLVIPIEDSFLYVQPVYVRARQENAIPELKRVLVTNGATVGVGANLSEALAAAVLGVTPPEDGEEPLPTGSVQEQIRQLLDEAQEHFALAQASLQAGDLGSYQDEIQLAEDLIAQAVALADQAAGETEGTSPSPSPSASPSA